MSLKRELVIHEVPLENAENETKIGESLSKYAKIKIESFLWNTDKEKGVADAIVSISCEDFDSDYRMERCKYYSIQFLFF